MPIKVEELVDQNYVELFILKKILTPIRENNRVKKLVALDERMDVVGLMSYRLNSRGIKRINTFVFDKGKGVGIALVRHLCRLYPNHAQYSINIPASWNWVKKMGMHEGKLLSTGNKEFYWSAEEVKAFGEQNGPL